MDVRDEPKPSQVDGEAELSGEASKDTARKGRDTKVKQAVETEGPTSLASPPAKRTRGKANKASPYKNNGVKSKGARKNANKN